MMKKQVTWFGLLCCLLLFAACEKPVLESNESGKKPNGTKEKLTRVVRIHPKELRVETIEEAMQAKRQPMSRANNEEKKKKKLYAVNVYEKKPNDESYSLYAYGLFTNLSKIALKMNVENLYKVECLTVEEGDDRLGTKDGEYLAPFLHGANKGTKAANTFVFSKDENMNNLTNSETIIANGQGIANPRLVKLYGTINDFSPKITKDLTIDMRKAVFGLRFKVTPPDEGKLVITYLGWRITVMDNSAAYDNSATYSFYDIVNASQEGYQATVDVKITWTKSDGTTEQENKQLTVKRNVMTVIDISVEGQKPQGFIFNEETGDMKTENIKWKLVL